MKHKARQRLFICVAAFAVVALFCSHLYRQSMYSVIDRDPFWVSIVTDNIGTVSSPDESHTLYITVHDAGATHSGNFKTWVTVKDLLSGRRIVAEGYSSYPVRYRRVPFPVEWVDENTCYITFNGGPEEKKVLVRLE